MMAIIPFPRTCSRCLLTTIFALAWLVCFGNEPTEDPSPAYEEVPLTDADRDHWSFRPVRQPLVPTCATSDWPTNAIDCYILQRIEQAGLTPAPQADRVVLLRRLKFDLLGLPVTADELDAWLNDSREDAYEAWVDRYLASPRYGERWGQPWLDLARFAETDGFEHDRVRAQAWRYRDWVIAALNSDMTYDRFVFQQVAGDTDSNQDEHMATMFCLAGPDMPDLNDQSLRRHDRMNELTSTIGSVLLGLQFHCAQCHDHKTDPISQGDFYRLRAVFESAVPVLERDKPYVVFSPDAIPSLVTPRIYRRGELQYADTIVQPAFPRIADPLAHNLRFCATDNPRVEFARWLFEPDHPMTSRVIVNRLWQSHFGRGLFENPSDVGLMYSDPSHPELLDWLAMELQRHAWSLKSIQRLIVLSSTYRQSSYASANETHWQERLNQDPENRLWCRFPRRRLEAEMVRDAMLSVAGLLDYRFGGESVMPPLPEELSTTLLKGQWKTSASPADHVRRSIYTFARRNLRYPLFDVFDRPDAGASCPRRDHTTTANQSLQMLNSQFSLDCASAMRARFFGLSESSPASHPLNSPSMHAIETIYREALGRYPSPNEKERAIHFLNAWKNDAPSSFTALCLALLNASEFVFVD